ncbi:MAG TPA: hypothetical protein V6D29_21660 [Leptolyngbyaceae cyanobacterium]
MSIDSAKGLAVVVQKIGQTDFLVLSAGIFSSAEIGKVAKFGQRIVQATPNDISKITAFKKGVRSISGYVVSIPIRPETHATTIQYRPSATATKKYVLKFTAEGHIGALILCRSQEEAEQIQRSLEFEIKKTIRLYAQRTPRLANSQQIRHMGQHACFSAKSY